MIRCQFNYILFLVVCVAAATLSCSSGKKNTEEKIPDQKLGNEIAYQKLQSAGWLKVPKRFSFKGQLSEYIHHPFFDEIPGRDFDRKILNAVILTPNNSNHLYNLDLPSGQIFKTFSFCSQKDLLGSISGSLNQPKFSLGIVPRILDESADPQKIVIFGDVSENIKPGMIAPVQVIGGVMEVECKTWPCNRGTGLQKRVVLLSYFLGDKEFKDVRNISDLKNIIDYPYFKAFMENSQGVHSGLALPKPAFLIKGQLNAEEALNMAFKDGHIFSSLELFSMRSSCHKIYDYVWDSVSKGKNKDKEKRLAKFNKNAPPDLYKNFKNFMVFFLKNYGDRYSTCTKYVRPSNPFDNSKRHWFFGNFTAFMNLRSLNYYYSCANSAWDINSFNYDQKKYEHNFENEIDHCDLDKLNFAFKIAPNKLQSLVKQNMESFRYLTFDESYGGSHQKIYGWVPFESFGPYCKNEKERKAFLQNFQQSFYPQDIRWEEIKELNL